MTTTVAPHLVFEPDGRVEVRALEEGLTPEALRDWIRARLRKADPYLAFDANDEAPHEVFVDLWRRALSGGRYRECLSRACLALIGEAWTQDPSEACDALLRLVSATQPDDCRQFLAQLVIHRNFASAVIDSNQDLLWLHAAASFPRQLPEALSAWNSLMLDPRYFALAYLALSHEIEPGVLHLPEYFRRTPPRARARVLKNALDRLLRQGLGALVETLRRNELLFTSPKELKPTVNASLISLGQQAVFETVGGENKLTNIGMERPKLRLVP